MIVAGVDVSGVLISSAVVAAIVAGLSSFFTQRYLLERKARVDYQYEASKRLNEVIGPLRMQLLLSARDVVRRVHGHAGHIGWDMDPSGSFVRTFVYRLLRPLAISQLIERQMSTADFSVDPAAIALLRFNTNAERLLSGSTVVLGHPGVDWDTQSQHLFRDNLRAAAARLIVEDEGRPVVVNYARFQQEAPDMSAVPELKDLTAIFASSGDNLANVPLFWLRVVGYAHACSRLISEQGADVGFDDVRLPVESMLKCIPDERISTRAPDYAKVFDEIFVRGL
jgi:hypothetical protein